MGVTIESDEHGALLVSAEALGQTVPGAGYSVEPHAGFVVLRREDEADRWFASHTPQERVAWLDEWIASLPASPPLPQGATDRDSMYE